MIAATATPIRSEEPQRKEITRVDRLNAGKNDPPTSVANPVLRTRPAVVGIFPSSWRLFVIILLSLMILIW